MKVLSIDWGSKRIGLALGDTRLKLATPLRPLENNGEVFSTLSSKSQQYGVGLVLVGLPLTPSGKEGQRSVEVRRFAQRLRESLPEDISLEFWDERHTTEEAHRLIEGIKKRKEFKDSLSAYVILIEFLDSL